VEFRAALYSDKVGAVVVTKPANLNDPLQQEIQTVLSEQFLSAGKVPPFLLGVRRR
jgi:hypothetical protein